MRKDIVMNEYLQSFLSFDLGEMDVNDYPHKYLDIPYYEDMKLDIYVPQEGGCYPVCLVIFGGGWVSGKKQSRFVAPMLQPLQLGYACVVAQYTLAVDDTFPRPVSDIKRAVCFIKEHAPEYGLDSSKIIIWGESAGAHLGLLAALMPDALAGMEAAQYNSRVDGIIAYYPLVNIRSVDMQAASLGMLSTPMYDRHALFGILLGEHFDTDLMVSASSPKTFLHDMMPPLFLEHGESDEIIPYLQSKELATAITQGYPNVRLHYASIPNKAHTDPWFFTMDKIREAFAFIEEKQKEKYHGI